MKTSGGRKVNRTELAEILGVAVTTIDAMVRRGLPYVQRATSKGKGWLFDTAEVRSWELQRAVENAIGDSEQIGKEEADKRRAIAQAALAEYELAERRREFISVDLAAEIVRRDYSAVRARLLSMPAKLGPELALTKDAGALRKAKAAS
jgi:phage terminase Nu1 subunit (DNA packaging protein)